MLEERKVTYTDSDINDFCNTAMRNYRKDDGTAYIIMIGGKRYSTPAGKSVWRKKNHASAAVTNHCKGIANNIIRNKLQALMLPDDFQRGYYYRQDAYKYALEHVLGILRANNMYEIRELDPHNIV